MESMIGLIPFLVGMIVVLLYEVYSSLPVKSKIIVKPYEDITMLYITIHYNIKYCIYKIFPLRFKYLEYFNSSDNKSYYQEFSTKESLEDFVCNNMTCTKDLLDYLEDYNNQVRKYKEELKSKVISL